MSEFITVLVSEVHYVRASHIMTIYIIRTLIKVRKQVKECIKTLTENASLPESENRKLSRD
jgi:hypothetical protein